jgi:hypothetical protein
LKEKARDMDRAFIVFESTVTADLDDESKYTNVIVVHTVCQGKELDLQNMKNYVSDVLKAIYKTWRKKVTDEAAAEEKKKESKDKERAALKKEEQIKTDNTGADEEEESLFEKTKLNWLFRELYIQNE